MVKIVKQEADCARRESPEGVNGAAEPRSTDILELLSKAKEEYQRAQGGKRDTSAELNVTAASSTAEHVHCSSQQEKSSPSKVKQITVEELFDSSLPKDATSVIFPVQHTTTACSGLSISYHQNQSCSAPAHLNQLPPSNLPSPDSRSNQQSQAPILPQAPYVLHPSPIFKSMVPKSEHQPLCSVFPLMMPPAGSEPHAAPPGCAASPCTTYMRKEVLSTLKPAVSSVHMNIHKPVLAPNFLPSALLPPHSFQEPTVIPPPQHMKEVDSLSQPSNLIKPLSTVAMRLGLAGPAAEISVLLSPSAFQQSMNKTPAAMSGFPPAPSELSSSDVGVVDPPEAPCRKAQLQETLIYLIKNDAAFFRAIHEHLQTVTNDFSNMKV
ncbi:mRNA-decapping enzyme 1A [Xyrichtys novacula]|nr:mRNA-decapping enzyme 1A [Xyrichtys novacula]